ncbi:ABC-F family ATP-binding cassette domain-containing protein [Candidatus Saccharibacteria bacterium]|nr:ABC-F family ATP-binding cassette domain-containing protein [Candidatus Saccharibacteria bacterium]TWO86838.1 ABC-F family ATP-binding cassette domain-containing protein [TM7 phylum sp. oral taxon 356]TWP25981.1 ABC-F family ATP-binding cassette domain-containing protein [TM7 phylum sp. oral taxon 346]
MIADVHITDKSFGDKQLMSGVKFSVNDGEKVGLIGRNGVGKSTLFGMLAGTDSDYRGSVVFRRGSTIVATAQEHHGLGDITVLEYILRGLPEYARLRHILTTYPATMGDDMRKIEEYSQALERFGQKDFYRVEELVAEELKNFQMEGFGERQLAALSGGQKRLVEVVKIMHAQADLALIDEPTNHMDYVAKKQFIDWMKSARQAMLIITHDRDVLAEVDRIVELRDGASVSYRGNYDDYLRQNASATGNAMQDYEQTERRIANLRDKVLQFRRLKEKARDPGTIAQFKRRENQAAAELEKLEKIDKPTFWIDRENVAQLDYKVADRYQKFKARNIRLNIRDGAMRSQRKLVEARDLALGFDERILFEGVNIDLREGEAIELRGRNGAGKTTLIRALMANAPSSAASSGRLCKTAQVPPQLAQALIEDTAQSAPIVYAGSLYLDPQIRVGIYEQEIAATYLNLPLARAIEQMYLDRGLKINDTKIRQLMGDYLFVESDGAVPLASLSGGQKARFQLISMLANEPQLLILDEPTNHLDLPSIEELEAALERYAGAILYVSHDDYFRRKIGGSVVQIGS